MPTCITLSDEIESLKDLYIRQQSQNQNQGFGKSDCESDP